MKDELQSLKFPEEDNVSNADESSSESSSEPEDLMITFNKHEAVKTIQTFWRKKVAKDPNKIVKQKLF